MRFIYRHHTKWRVILSRRKIVTSKKGQEDMIAMLSYLKSETTQVPSSVDNSMKEPTTGICALNFGTHTWCRPIKDDGLGYFLNVSHQSDNALVSEFSTTGITASQYKYNDNDDTWHIEPFIATNNHDIVTKLYLTDVIKKLEKRIDILEKKVNDKRI